MNQKIKSILELLVIIIIFAVVTYFVKSNLEFFQNLIGKNIWGLIIYVLIIILASVVVPISSIPLIPIVSNVWGWQITGAVSVFGWTLGAIAIFIISRKYGKKIVKRIISLETLQKIEKIIPKENQIILIIFLRLIIPVDLLSYALGLFSKIKFWPYTIATFIGVIPFAFALAYLGTVSLKMQAISFIAFTLFIIIVLLIKEGIKGNLIIKE